MKPFIIRVAPSLAASLLLLALGAAAAEPLSLTEAEGLALERDPDTTRYQDLAAARDADAVAATYLPNPMLVGEAMNLPLDDGLRLDRTPMTQIALGLQQTFPRGETRELTRKGELARAAGERARALDAQRQALAGVRSSYLELLHQQNAVTLLEDVKGLFEELLVTSEREFGSGRGTQQGMLEAELELDRLQDRISVTRAAESAARAEFTRWVGGAAAARPLSAEHPDLPGPGGEAVATHPRVRVLEAELDAGRHGIDLADQGYRPEWTMQLRYGRAPGAREVGGVDRLSAMLMVDLPLFGTGRQDQERRAAEHRRDAAMLAVVEQVRDLEAQALASEARMQRLGERDRRFRERLLNTAEANARAAESAYRSGTQELSDWLRARVLALETRLDALRVATDLRQAQAELLYLRGEQQ